jgi:branched-chain amino acid transport system ATP-binding protein
VTTDAAIEARGVEVRFGALMAVDGVDLVVAAGERRALIGPNGAGKTTLFGVLTGELGPSAGRVRIFGEDVTTLPPHLRARRGLGRTFQRNNLFARLSVRENVRLAVQVRQGLGPQVWRPVDAYPDMAAEVGAALERVGLADRGDRRVSDLSYGEQRQLELALALAVRPRLLLLDEPTAGMSPAETAQMVRLLADLPRALTLLIIEHDMDVVAALADSITVMHAGEILADGPADAVRVDPRVQAAYLGGALGGAAPSDGAP